MAKLFDLESAGQDFQQILADLSDDYERRWWPTASVGLSPYIAQAREWGYADGDSRGEGTIADIMDAITSGAEIPPLIVGGPELLDGRHRCLACERLGVAEFQVIDLQRV